MISSVVLFEYGIMMLGTVSLYLTVCFWCRILREFGVSVPFLDLFECVQFVIAVMLVSENDASTCYCFTNGI